MQRDTTVQGLYNDMFNGLAAQGWRVSRNVSGVRCMYKGPNDCKCAIGHLIADEAYDARYEGYAQYHEGVQKMLEESGVDINDNKVRDLLMRAQPVHDDNSSETLKDKFIALGEELGLEIPDGR